VLDLLKMDNIGVVPLDLGNGIVNARGSLIGIFFIPNLTKLHVELQDAEGLHTKEEEEELER